MPNNTIADNLQRLVDAKNDIADAIVAKGGTVNEGDGLEEFSADIATIPSGGGDSHFKSNVNVTTEPGAVVTATRVSIQLNVKAHADAPITITDGFTTLTGTGTGDWQIFWLPNTETWAISDGTRTKYTIVSDTSPKSVDITTVSIYGIEWMGTSDPSCTRTDDSELFEDPDPYVADDNHLGSSPFDGIWPWSGMVKEIIGEDVFVKIPKFWIKITKDGTKRKIQIADNAVDGFMVSPAHQDRGDGNGERDCVYVSRYHVNSGYKSKPGTPLVSITRATARSGCAGRGTGYCQFDMMTLITIWYLYLVEFAHWDSQLKIGYGCGNGSAKQATGASDGMSYHTGTIQSSRETYGAGTQYRWIEDLWGNIYDYVDGIYFSSSTIYAIKNPVNFSDSSGGTNVGFTRPTSSATIQSWGDSLVSGYEWFTFPNYVYTNYSYNSYCCDEVVYSSSGTILFFGGMYSNSRSYGLFGLDARGSASSTSVYVGARLLYLPPNS